MNEVDVKEVRGGWWKERQFVNNTGHNTCPERALEPPVAAKATMPHSTFMADQRQRQN